VVECGGVWWSVVECGGVWLRELDCGGVWLRELDCGGVWWSKGEVINIHTMRRSDEKGRRKGGVWWRELVELTSLISIQYVIILCNDVTRACSGQIGQNLLTTHFFASLHVCDTIEGLRLVYYE
jgi:hypothetical protein